MKKIFILFILFLNIKNIEATNDNDSKRNSTEEEQEIKDIQKKNEDMLELRKNLEKTKEALNPSNQ